jgi:hypothetical protein
MNEETKPSREALMAEVTVLTELVRVLSDKLAIEQNQRTWVGLTDDEVSNIIDDVIGFNSCWGPETDFARAIEAKLKEKNT